MKRKTSKQTRNNMQFAFNTEYVRLSGELIQLIKRGVCPKSEWLKKSDVETVGKYVGLPNLKKLDYLSFRNQLIKALFEISGESNKERLCALCGKRLNKLEGDTHHIDENKENNNPENLIVLCDKSHHRVHHDGFKNDVISVPFRDRPPYEIPVPPSNPWKGRQK